MIAYNHKILDDTRSRNASEEALQKNLITRQEHQAICSKYPGEFYSPNLFIRIGLFVLTAVISVMAFGVFALFFSGAAGGFVEMLGIFFSLIAYFVLERMAGVQKHFKSGVDDALIWVSAVSMLASIIILFDPLAPLAMSLLVCAFALYFAIRFVNAAMAAISFISLLAFAFYLALYLGTTGKIIAPFLLMALSFGAYLLVKKMENNYRFRYYELCFTTVELLALIGVYVSVNYLVVRELSEALFGLNLGQGDSIPGGWLFWMITIILPLIYLIVSFKRKDTLLLRVSLLLIAATIFTIQFYYHFLPADIVMLLGGAGAVLLAYGVSKYFAKGRNGITSAAPEVPSAGRLNLEALVIAEAFHVSSPNVEKGFEFGGGSGGGGGATGEY